MKELWIAEYERIVGELMDDGVPESEAERIASTQAMDAARDRLADVADNYRMQVKEGSRKASTPTGSAAGASVPTSSSEE